MHRFSLLFVVFCCTFISLSGQVQKYHRGKISLENKNPLLLLRAGITLDHGKMAIGRYFESDFSDDEIKAIKQMGFEVNILIKDVENYYANPNRPSELNYLYSASRSNDCSLSPLDYPTPNNYFDGSMGGYFTYDEMFVILEWMHTNYPSIISKIDTIDGYKTTDGNRIIYLKVSDNPQVDEDEPEVLYTALHHAREPNSLSQMIFYLWYLLENYQSNPEIKYLINNTEMYFVPCVNPDGYKLNEKNKPNGGGMWRKNTRKDSTGKLVGVDLNRNYGYEWGYDNTGSSNNPNSDTYRGASAFSEAETSAIREFCVGHKFILALNYHTFGNLLIHPWGYNDTPTAEDQLFKSIGSIMNSENNFKMGTGTQTVGYTVNGDSDDYMYGDEIEKNKIYSYTPEVGPSFWPAKSDIDYLNKSCMKMNLTLPRMVNALLDHTIIEKSDNYALKDTLTIEFSKASFKKENVNVTVAIDDKYSGSAELSQSLNLNQGEKFTLKFPFEINGEKLSTGKNEVKIKVTKEYEGYTTVDSSYIDFFEGDNDTIFQDAGDDLIQWEETTNWGLSTIPDFYVSAPSSLTDSPSALYGRNTTNKIVLKSGLDLSSAINPILTFKARWNIEKSFDYAAIYAYVPGKDTIWLCGNYTVLGSIDQKKGYPVYDGEQESFVAEVMSLDALAGQKDVYIAMEMVSDGFLEMDGFYIDDIEVLSFKDRLPNGTNDVQERVILYPNPTSGLLKVKGNINNSRIKIYDFTGSLVLNSKISDGDAIDCRHLTSGIYASKIELPNGEMILKNIVITK